MSGYQYRGARPLDRDPVIARERELAGHRNQPARSNDEACCRVCSARVKSTGLPVCASHVPDELGITYRQLDHWSRAGYLRPGRQHHGRPRSYGNARAWALQELAVARLMGRLVRVGLTPQTAARAARSGQSRTQIAAGIWIEVTP